MNLRPETITRLRETDICDLQKGCRINFSKEMEQDQNIFGDGYTTERSERRLSTPTSSKDNLLNPLIELINSNPSPLLLLMMSEDVEHLIDIS